MSCGDSTGRLGGGSGCGRSGISFGGVIGGEFGVSGLDEEGQFAMVEWLVACCYHRRMGAVYPAVTSGNGLESTELAHNLLFAV